DHQLKDKAILLEEFTHQFQRRMLIPFRLYQHVEDLAFGIDGPPQVDHAAGTPDAIVQKMNATMNEIAQRPEIAALLLKVGLFPNAGPPADLTAIMRKDFERYGKLTRELNIRQD
ncbi:MAG: hypothetical protein EXR08_12515, partial [Alphaproteobacteria bacterium]|nr:hypothetical protein [Alphaproteobacteria bacterium]